MNPLINNSSLSLSLTYFSLYHISLSICLWMGYGLWRSMVWYGRVHGEWRCGRFVVKVALMGSIAKDMAHMPCLLSGFFFLFFFLGSPGPGDSYDWQVVYYLANNNNNNNLLAVEGTSKTISWLLEEKHIYVHLWINYIFFQCLVFSLCFFSLCRGSMESKGRRNHVCGSNSIRTGREAS